VASKKSFKADINPAMQFISQPFANITEAGPIATFLNEPAEEKIPESKAPEGYKSNPVYIETKSRRLQLLIQPSLHLKLKARAKKERKSVNELINNFLEEALKTE
jgi:hypothetical protein